MLTINIYTKSFAFLLITKLRNYPIILYQPWMKKYRVIIYMTNNFLVFWPSYYTYIGAISPITLNQLGLPIKIAVV